MVQLFFPVNFPLNKSIENGNNHFPEVIRNHFETTFLGRCFPSEAHNLQLGRFGGVSLRIYRSVNKTQPLHHTHYDTKNGIRHFFLEGGFLKIHMFFFWWVSGYMVIFRELEETSHIHSYLRLAMNPCRTHPWRVVMPPDFHGSV